MTRHSTAKLLKHHSKAPRPHRKNLKDIEKPFTCPHPNCSTLFKTSRGRDTHVTRIHGGWHKIRKLVQEAGQHSPPSAAPEGRYSNEGLNGQLDYEDQPMLYDWQDFNIDGNDMEEDLPPADFCPDFVPNAPQGSSPTETPAGGPCQTPAESDIPRIRTREKHGNTDFVIEHFVGAAAILGKGQTLFDKIKASRQEYGDVAPYYPFASVKDFEMAAYLTHMDTTVRKEDGLYKLEMVLFHSRI